MWDELCGVAAMQSVVFLAKRVHSSHTSAHICKHVVCSARISLHQRCPPCRVCAFAFAFAFALHADRMWGATVTLWLYELFARRSNESYTMQRLDIVFLCCRTRFGSVRTYVRFISSSLSHSWRVSCCSTRQTLLILSRCLGDVFS